MSSSRTLLFDYALVAGLVVLLFSAAGSFARSRRPDAPNSERWIAVVAAVGLVTMLGVLMSDSLDAVTGGNRDSYPDLSRTLIVLGFIAASVLALAVYDSLSSRATQVANRVLPAGWMRVASVPILIVLGVSGLVGVLWKLEPERVFHSSEADVATTTTTTTRPSRPMTITFLPSPIAGGSGLEAAPDLTLSAMTKPGELQLPTFLTSAPNDNRLFVLERLGRVRVIKDGELRSETLLDITDSVRPGGDGGLLGLAFHPDFADNGRMFVFYTDLNDDNRLVEYQVDPVAAILTGEPPLEILVIEQPSDLHAGGTLQFGPEGLLYVSVGDGGTHADPDGNAQNPDVLLGGILRIDVDSASPYAIPAANAFGDRQPSETFAYGLRNPYRFWIDPPTNRMFIGDAGQFYWEEINVLDLDTSGVNFGWVVTEGTTCFLDEGFVSDCDRSGFRFPIVEYQNAAGFTNRSQNIAGCAVLGGPTYRGDAIPALQGRTFFADYCRNWLIGFTFEDGKVGQTWAWEPADELTLGTPLSFGVDGDGEMYILTSADGMIYKILEG